MVTGSFLSVTKVLGLDWICNNEKWLVLKIGGREVMMEDREGERDSEAPCNRLLAGMGIKPRSSSFPLPLNHV